MTRAPAQTLILGRAGLTRSRWLQTILLCRSRGPRWYRIPGSPDINVITLNCWGLKHISKLRDQRFPEIGRRIASASPQPHVVALQEIFCQEDYLTIRRETRFVLPYGKYYHGGAFGAGLAILSKWPIEESSMVAYPLNGRPTAFWRGDWYVGKGVACAKIRFGPGRRDVVEVFNTHLHSRYSGDQAHTYDCHIASQAWHIAKLLRGAAERGHLVLALGDFNILPATLPYRIITAHAPVRDAWRLLHPDSALGPAHHPAEIARRRPIPTADYNLAHNGATSDNVSNTWRWDSTQKRLLARGLDHAAIVPRDSIDKPGKRLDYLFFGSGDLVPSDSAGWVVRRMRVGMTDPHPTARCSLSDHYAVEATLSFHIIPSPPSPTPAPTPRSTGSTVAALSNGTYLRTQDDRDIHRATAQLHSAILASTDSSFSTAAYDELLALIASYTRRELAQRSRRSAHFFASLVVLVGCLRVSWASLILEPVRPYELLEHIPLPREESLFPVNLLVHRARVVGGIDEFDRCGMHLFSHTPEQSLNITKA
ncbi:unnamed protein product [Parascedosporium putredinis]|uniref:Endonuclease/exonuclease/phosphatase domain-containing protein n=1 Tax=Parascedosporium putredinis TaxID=1442378 RepID=A0A9P1H7R1_9PEZI|nr:unnamed protein product [Parascedosporium putredinis]CAI7998691.1 unnamed protein product [Parascedosporium putredinis]